MIEKREEVNIKLGINRKMRIEDDEEERMRHAFDWVNA